MRGFLKKDLYLTLGYCRSIFVIVIVFMCIGCVQKDNFFFLYYPAIMVSLIAVTLLSYDEREHFCAYADAMPQTRSVYVTAKYLLGLLYGVGCSVFICLLQILPGNYSGSELLYVFSVLVILVLLTPAVTLPFMFRFGVEKGRIAYYIMIGFSTALAILIGRRGAFYDIGADIPFVFPIIAVVVIFAVSWRLSIRFYSKREF